MSWLENHDVSARFAAEAEAALHAGREDDAACLYAKAAEAEVRAVAALNPSNQRTLGITTVSAVSLRLKAARCTHRDTARADLFARAEETAQTWLNEGCLPAFAEDQLRSALLSIPVGGNMRLYLDHVHERAEEQGRCVSELLFEDYCTRAGIHWTRIAEGQGKTPDYELVVDDRTIIAEVKEITQNKEARESYRLQKERGYGTVLGGKPGARVRKKITDSSPQIKARTADRHPGLLVLYDNGGTGFGPHKKMAADANTSISAIGALVVTAPDLVLGFHVYHNPFAAVPIEPAILARRGIPQFRTDFGNRTWVELC